MNYVNHGKTKIYKVAFLNLSINPFFYKFHPFFLIIFFIYMKMSKNLSATYYQENKERLQKRARERYENLSKEKKKQHYGSERYKNLSEDKKR